MKLERKAADLSPLVDQLEVRRAYLSRARTRRNKLWQEREDRKQALEALKKDIGDREDELQSLEQDALREATAPPGMSTAEATAAMSAELQGLPERSGRGADRDAEKSPPAKRTKTEASALQAEEVAPSLTTTVAEGEVEKAHGAGHEHAPAPTPRPNAGRADLAQVPGTLRGPRDLPPAATRRPALHRRANRGRTPIRRAFRLQRLRGPRARRRRAAASLTR